MKKTIIVAGLFLFGFLFSLSVSAQTEIKKEDDKTIKTEQTVTKSTETPGTVTSTGTKTVKPPCDPSKCKSTCGHKTKKKTSCCPSSSKAKKGDATEPKKEE